MKLGAVVIIVILEGILWMVSQADPWIWQSAEKWDEEWNKGMWKYLNQAPLERGRVALIGSVLLHSYAPPNASILDVGCAEGSLVDFLTSTQQKYFLGIDISKVAIDKAAALHPSVKFTRTVAHEFRTDRKWDVIIFSEVLNYVEHENILKQFEGYLSETGIIIISMFHMEGHPSLKNIFTFARNRYDVVDRMELGGLTPTANAVNSHRQWSSSRIEVYRQKKKSL